MGHPGAVFRNLHLTTFVGVGAPAASLMRGNGESFLEKSKFQGMKQRRPQTGPVARRARPSAPINKTEASVLFMGACCVRKLIIRDGP